MRKIWLAAALTVFVLSCGGRDKEGGSAGNKVENNTKAKPQSASQSQGQDPSELDKMVRGSIKPFFDKEASVTSRAVSPGESFEVFVFGGCSSSYTMSAAEFRLSLPEGVIITGEIKSDSTNITMGETLKDYMMAFRCMGGPKFMLMKYNCRANDSFQGGSVAIHEGLKMHFLGFTLCDEDRTMAKAIGGSAALTRN